MGNNRALNETRASTRLRKKIKLTKEHVKISINSFTTIIHFE